MPHLAAPPIIVSLVPVVVMEGWAGVLGLGMVRIGSHQSVWSKASMRR